MPLIRKDIKAYLYVLNQPSIMYYLPILVPNNLAGCLVRLEEQLVDLTVKRPKSKYWRSLLEQVRDRERLNGIVDPSVITKAELAENTKNLALRLWSIYCDTTYRKMLRLADGTRHKLSPVTAQEFQMFHGGNIEIFKKNFGFVELSDFPPEQLEGAKVLIYDYNGMSLSWSDWNACISFGEEMDSNMSEMYRVKEEDIVD